MIFVTGGTGLVGSHVLLKLVEKGYLFKALKREKSSLSVCRSVFKYYNQEESFLKINWVNGDITDIISLEELIVDCDQILHCAAIVSFNTADYNLMRKVNVEGTKNIVNTALNLGIKKLGYVSSIATLGRNSTNDTVDEECHFKFSKKESYYAISKYYAEQEVWRGSQEGLDVIIINPSVILGPGNWNRGSSQIFKKIFNGLIFYAPGSTGYVDVFDVSEALLELFFSDIKNERFILNGKNLSYRECFDRIALCLGKKKATIKVTPFLKSVAWRVEKLRSFFTGNAPLITRETANSSMRRHSYSAKKIKNKIGFEFTDINDTIKKYCAWFISDFQ